MKAAEALAEEGEGEDCAPPARFQVRTFLIISSEMFAPLTESESNCSFFEPESQQFYSRAFLGMACVAHADV